MAPSIHHEKSFAFYPAFCHRASPTYFSWVKMRVADVRHLTARTGFAEQNIYFYKNHPIQFVCVAGMIVSRVEKPRCTILTLDDSSGQCIDVVCAKIPVHVEAKEDTSGASQEELGWQDETTPDKTDQQYHVDTSSGSLLEAPTVHATSTAKAPLNISALFPGIVVKIKGTISSFYNVLEIALERFEILPDTQSEMAFWRERMRYMVEVLSIPWHLTEQEISEFQKLTEAEAVEQEKAILAKKGRKRRESQRGMGWKKEVEAGRLAREKRRTEREKKHSEKILRTWTKEEHMRQIYADRCKVASGNWTMELRRKKSRS